MSKDIKQLKRDQQKYTDELKNRRISKYKKNFLYEKLDEINIQIEARSH